METCTVYELQTTITGISIDLRYYEHSNCVVMPRSYKSPQGNSFKFSLKEKTSVLINNPNKIVYRVWTTEANNVSMLKDILKESVIKEVDKAKFSLSLLEQQVANIDHVPIAHPTNLSVRDDWKKQKCDG